MKYMIMTFGADEALLEAKSKEWIKEMIDFMNKVNEDLTKAGELVDAQGLAWADQAKTVRFKDGIPVATDGPFGESKEALAGYWVVDVANEERAIEIASRIVAFIEEPIEVRQIMDAPPEF